MRVGLGRAGIAEWGIRQDIPREARLRHGCELDTVAAFRDRFSYSNLCYIALCLAAERLTGKTYATLVRDLVRAPLGMTPRSEERRVGHERVRTRKLWWLPYHEHKKKPTK